MKVDVIKKCVSNWENDNVMPSVDMLTNIADFFGVTTDFLLGRTEAVSVDVQGLNSEQIAHVRLIVSDLKSLNKAIYKSKTD